MNMFGGLEIKNVAGRKILDSQGNPALEAEVTLENGARGRASASLCTGAELCREAMDTGGFLAEAILYEDASDQRRIDGLLLQAAGEGKRGRTAVLALSMACARAAGAGMGLPLYRYLGGTSAPALPKPMLTMISGDGGLDFEDFLIIPDTGSYAEGIRWGAEIYAVLKRLLALNGCRTSVGKSGGFAPNLKNAEEALQYLKDAIRLSGHKPGEEVTLAVNAGAGRLYSPIDGCYFFEGESRNRRILVNREERDMIDYYLRLDKGFPLSCVLNAFKDEDKGGREQLAGLLGHRLLLVSSDGFGASGVIISLEEAGCVTRALKRVELAKKAGKKVVISSLEGKTEEVFLTDFAAAVGADYIQCGAPARGEHTFQYNELLRLAEIFEKYGCIYERNMVL